MQPLASQMLFQLLLLENQFCQVRLIIKFYILVYKNIGSPETVIQLEAGYDYKIGNDINVKIDKGAYSFYTTEEIKSFEVFATFFILIGVYLVNKKD